VGFDSPAVPLVRLTHRAWLFRPFSHTAKGVNLSFEKGRGNFDQDTVWGARDRRSAAGSTAFDYDTTLGAAGCFP
jgi:hypothetical protein